MTRLDGVLAGLLRFSARLLPAARREWAEAVLIEAAAIPAGRARLAWLAGGLRMVIGQARLARMAGWWLVFCLAAAAVARFAWSGRAASPATLINRVDVLATLVLLAGLPLAVRRLFGPAGASLHARLIRAGGYASVLALTVVKASAERFGYPPAGHQDAGILWIGEITFLVLMTGYIGAVLAATASRSPAAPATLATGISVGTASAAAMFLRAHLHPGGGSLAWLVTTWTVLTILALLTAPVLAGTVAARRVRTADGRHELAVVRSRQGALAGLGAGLTGALALSVAGTGAAALLPHAPRLLAWAYPMSHLTGPGAIRYEVNVSQAAAFYLIALMFFPLLGAGLAAWGGLAVAGRPGSKPGGGGGGGPAPPAPVPPPGGLDLVPRLGWPAAGPVRGGPLPLPPSGDGAPAPAREDEVSIPIGLAPVP